MIRLYRYGDDPDRQIFARQAETADVSAAVKEILAAVEQRGDAAVLEYGRCFDGAAPEQLEADAAAIEKAREAVGEDFLQLLERAAGNIRAYHAMQRREGFEIRRPDGVILGERILPLRRAGLYVPGGTAAYPSTVLMNVIPAKIAGCEEVVLVSPPTCGGEIHPAILAAASVAGADRIFRCGGAQAIAALAFGTETIPAADKITGPGNVYVAEAKRQVFGRVAIDMIAGPSEILIIADGEADPTEVSADLLSQAEHDKNASAVLVTDSESLAAAVQAELERQIPLLPRKEIARASVDNNGKIILTEDLLQAARIADRLAPEHVELCVKEPCVLFEKIRSAGSVFLGRYCPEALGDYYAGPNHTLPTGGTARFSSALSVDDFIRKTQYIYYTEKALKEEAPDIAAFARREGLEAHARSALVRFDREVIQ
ncbi:MAG: histidinol dehydrogenase [Lachnospiraceae bacterium]|nr:histidinol dehydrogenase [Lachnospiraceae bacterium]